MEGQTRGMPKGLERIKLVFNKIIEFTSLHPSSILDKCFYVMCLYYVREYKLNFTPGEEFDTFSGELNDPKGSLFAQIVCKACNNVFTPFDNEPWTNITWGLVNGSIDCTAPLPPFEVTCYDQHKSTIVLLGTWFYASDIMLELFNEPDSGDIGVNGCKTKDIFSDVVKTIDNICKIVIM